mmetsp:Transcript_19017/g.30265  ORF Transcript_19017/g.30265 Transcript_19017/m.30265 type:complete len:313 (+) Transcript_19017:70-1008(+)
MGCAQTIQTDVVENTQNRAQSQQTDAETAMSCQTDIHIDEQTVNDWRHFSKIGSGAASHCFSYINVYDGRMVAVKTLLNERMARKEFELLKTMRHSNIVRVYYLDRNERDVYMEHCAGCNLDVLCDRLGPLQEQMISKYLSQIASAISYMHDMHNVIHCDLKPGNIMVDAQNGIKVIDFGSALKSKSISDDNTDNEITSINSNIEFTALYAAPELIHGTQITTAIDIWSIGCIIVKMVTAADPWSEEKFVNASVAMFHIAKTDAVPVLPSTASVSTALQGLLQQCLLIREPQQRITAADIGKHSFCTLYHDQ